MTNLDIKVAPIGFAEFFVNIVFPFLNFDPVITSTWSRTGIGGSPGSLPAKEGIYTWKKSTRQVVFLDPGGNPIMSFEEVNGIPIIGGESGPGNLLFGTRKGTMLNWFAANGS